ncbi:MAG: PEP-CTERM sorting domain-containing protein, partial [Caldimonas sp.]
QQTLTNNVANVQNAINGWGASGGGDFPEANFFALKQVADTTAWRPEAQRLVVWFGDAYSHTATTTQAQAIAALDAANAKVIAFNNGGAGAGIDQFGQASGIVGAPGVGGTLINNFNPATDFVGAVLAQIDAAASFIDLVFGSSFAGPGLNLTFTCTDALGCDDVGALGVRTFDLTIKGLLPGVYDFSVFAQGVAAVELDHIVVTGIPEPETYALMLAGLAAMGAVARRRRRQG